MYIDCMRSHMLRSVHIIWPPFWNRLKYWITSRLQIVFGSLRKNAKFNTFLKCSKGQQTTLYQTKFVLKYKSLNVCLSFTLLFHSRRTNKLICWSTHWLYSSTVLEKPGYLEIIPSDNHLINTLIFYINTV